MSYLRNLYLFGNSGVHHILCCVFLFFCLPLVSCVPKVVSFSELSIGFFSIGCEANTLHVRTLGLMLLTKGTNTIGKSRNNVNYKFCSTIVPQGQCHGKDLNMRRIYQL
jgi:hypothetical protein